MFTESNDNGVDNIQLIVPNLIIRLLISFAGEILPTFL